MRRRPADRRIIRRNSWTTCASVAHSNRNLQILFSSSSRSRFCLPDKQDYRVGRKVWNIAAPPQNHIEKNELPKSCTVNIWKCSKLFGHGFEFWCLNMVLGEGGEILPQVRPAGDAFEGQWIILFLVFLLPYFVKMSLKHCACHTFRASTKNPPGTLLDHFCNSCLLIFRISFAPFRGSFLDASRGCFRGAFWLLLLSLRSLTFATL